MLYYSEQYDQLGIYVPALNAILITDGTIHIGYTASRWEYVGDI